MWGLLDKSISESLPVMTWVWQCPPVSVFLFAFWHLLDFLLMFHICSVLGLLLPHTPSVGYCSSPGKRAESPVGLGYHVWPFLSLCRKSVFLSSPSHSLISWNTGLSLRIVNLFSKWTNCTGCVSLLFPALADLLFIAFPKIFACSSPSNPASKMWHGRWK